jgi:NAD+ kinase
VTAPLTFSSVALVGRPADANVAESMTALAAHLASRGRKVVTDAASAALVIAVGGDGTMLHAARLVAQRPVPLLGINRGRLGFLADVSPEDMLVCLDEILNGQYSQEHRTLLEAHLSDGSTMPALNDVVLQKGEAGKLLDFETWIDGRYVNTHSGDGLIVATATGSTAYALSCGGPIVHPELNVLVLAPICPHTLSDRPVVVPGASKVEIRLAGRTGARGQVVCDGVQMGELQGGDRLLVQPSPNKVTLLHPGDYDYYRLLRSKLHWGRGPQNGPALER